MKFINLFLLLAIVSATALAQNNPIVVSSINPIHQIVLAITEDKNNSILIISPTISEHDYQLKRSGIDAIAKADLIFYIDESLEKNFVKLVQQKKSYQLSQISKIKLLRSKNNPKKIDPHLWMNPENALKIAEFITQKLCETAPDGCKKYQKNLDKFAEEIVKTEKIISADLLKVKNQNYVFYHDGYQYFEDYFGLKSPQIIFKNHEYELNVKAARELDILAKNGQIKCLLGDALDEKNSVKKLAEKYKINFAKLNVSGGGGDYFQLLSQVSNAVNYCLI